jgi:hypothetical protein
LSVQRLQCLVSWIQTLISGSLPSRSHRATSALLRRSDSQLVIYRIWQLGRTNSSVIPGCFCQSLRSSILFSLLLRIYWTVLYWRVLCCFARMSWTNSLKEGLLPFLNNQSICCPTFLVSIYCSASVLVQYRSTSASRTRTQDT